VLHWVLSVILVGAWAGDVCAESITLTTSYPAPSGVYQRLNTKTLRFTPYETLGKMQSGDPPQPGTIVYNKETDGYYVSVAGADPKTPSTWYMRLAVAPPEEITVEGEVKVGFNSVKNSSIYVAPWTVDGGYGSMTTDKRWIYMNQALSSTGQYHIKVSGRVCELNFSTTRTGYGGPLPAPTSLDHVTLSSDYQGIIPGTQTSFSDVYISDKLTQDCPFPFTGTYYTPEAKEISATPEDWACYCSDSAEIDSTVQLTRGTKYYFGVYTLLTQTTKSFRTQPGNKYHYYYFPRYLSNLKMEVYRINN